MILNRDQDRIGILGNLDTHFPPFGLNFMALFKTAAIAFSRVFGSARMSGQAGSDV